MTARELLRRLDEVERELRDIERMLLRRRRVFS